MLMVILLARSSIPRNSVRFRHIQAGFVNRLLDMFVNVVGPACHGPPGPLKPPFELRLPFPSSAST
jgi:hypothetical protein